MTASTITKTDTAASTPDEVLNQLDTQAPDVASITEGDDIELAATTDVSDREGEEGTAVAEWGLTLGLGVLIAVAIKTVILPKVGVWLGGVAGKMALESFGL